MKTKEFLRKHPISKEWQKWIRGHTDMSDVWDALVEKGPLSLMLDILACPGVFDIRELGKFACAVVRETPLSDGRFLFDLLEDNQLSKAFVIAEQFPDGKISDAEIMEPIREALGVNPVFDETPVSSRWSARSAAANAILAAAGDALVLDGLIRGAYYARYATEMAYETVYRAHTEMNAVSAAKGKATSPVGYAMDACVRTHMELLSHLSNPFKKGDSSGK